MTTTPRFHTRRLRHSSGTVQVIDSEGRLRILHLPEDDADHVCAALNEKHEREVIV